jgi:hypothetical protein
MIMIHRADFHCTILIGYDDDARGQILIIKGWNANFRILKDEPCVFCELILFWQCLFLNDFERMDKVGASV